MSRRAIPWPRSPTFATGRVTPVLARTSGVFYARPATRIAEVGKRLGKIAGAVPFRGGLLLSP